MHASGIHVHFSNLKVLPQARKLCLLLTVAALLLTCGCQHTLEVTNLSKYGATPTATLEEPLVVGFKIPQSMETAPDGQMGVQAVNCLYKHNIKPIYPFNAKQEAASVDVIAEVDMLSSYGGSGWNFLINFPGFLIWTPAWHGYVYEADYTFKCRLLNPADNRLLDSWEVPIHFDIRHADLDRTWTEISWLEWGVIAFAGGLCFIQYDDDVTPILVQETKSTVGEHLCAQLVQHLKNAKIARHAAVQAVRPIRSGDLTTNKLQVLRELMQQGVLTKEEYEVRRAKLIEQL